MLKTWHEEMKAEPLTTSQLDDWLAGHRPRGVLVIPFTGPLPGGKAGLDLDGEFFDEDTDLYGPFPVLRSTRERMVDWHHDQDPTGVMKGAIVGRVILDQEPIDGEGLWGAFWANAGEKRRHLLAALERNGVPLYGSSQPVQGAVAKSGAHIDMWPIIRHTITTSPQNTHARVPTLKALLDGYTTGEVAGTLTVDALLASFVEQQGMSPLQPLPGISTGREGAGKDSGLDPRLSARLSGALAELSDLL